MNTTIKIYNDSDAQNPRTSRDGQPPLITRWWRYYWDNGYWIDIVQFIQSKLHNKNMYAIADVLWYSREDIEKEKSYYSDKKSIEVIADYICDEWTDLEDIENILDILKVKNYRWTSRWYSQWEVIDCILIATDEWIKDTGIKTKDIDLRGESKLFDARAWWDVYWYRVIEYKDTFLSDWTMASIKEEELNSCSWYYGDELDSIYDEVKSYWITKEQFEEAKENLIY